MPWVPRSDLKSQCEVHIPSDFISWLCFLTYTIPDTLAVSLCSLKPKSKLPYWPVHWLFHLPGLLSPRKLVFFFFFTSLGLYIKVYSSVTLYRPPLTFYSSIPWFRLSATVDIQKRVYFLFFFLRLHMDRAFCLFIKCRAPIHETVSACHRARAQEMFTK